MIHTALPPAFLFLLFLGFLGALVLVITVLLGRTKPDGSVPGKLCLGCGGGCLLGCLGFLGLLALTLSLVVLTGSAIVRHGPVSSIQLERGTPVAIDQGTPAERQLHPVHLRLELRGQVEIEGLREWLEQETDGEVLFESSKIRTPGGGRRTRLDFYLQVPDADMRRLERDLRRELPSLGLPASVKIDLGHDA
ncbi:MAG: hypothetical protein QF724_09610 [Planctomycetota bacterium]|jgi:hypothetical protein|nr:hypothetical protein [Planctomycetota bacterium]MDP6519244.1 hypothetical protein [Planctomycetota bacterium]MDP6839180.1 hypothetical protein [Planctomycetota bacterium]